MCSWSCTRRSARRACLKKLRTKTNRDDGKRGSCVCDWQNIFRCDQFPCRVLSLLECVHVRLFTSYGFFAVGFSLRFKHK